jgi:glycogen synthase
MKLKILMLGWEFPPLKSGGLGTACYGLTRALVRLGAEVAFVLPRMVRSNMSDHLAVYMTDEV